MVYLLLFSLIHPYSWRLVSSQLRLAGHILSLYSQTKFSALCYFSWLFYWLTRIFWLWPTHCLWGFRFGMSTRDVITVTMPKRQGRKYKSWVSQSFTSTTLRCNIGGTASSNCLSKFSWLTLLSLCCRMLLLILSCDCFSELSAGLRWP